MKRKQKILVLIIILPLLVGTLYSQDVAYSPENQLDLNNATFEQITRLPIPVELAEKIYTRILYQGPLSNVYELNQIEGMDPAQTGSLLDVDHDIAVRTGLECAPQVHVLLGTDPKGTVRFSIGAFNEKDHIIKAIEAVKDIATQ